MESVFEREPPLEPRVALEEHIFKLVWISRDDYAAVFSRQPGYLRDERVDHALPEDIRVIRAAAVGSEQHVRIVDDQHAAHCVLENLLCFYLRFTNPPAY